MRYNDPHGSVDFGFALTESQAVAQRAVRSARLYAEQLGKGNGARCEESIGNDPSFVKAPPHIAWRRGAFFFSAKASDGATLDRFMQDFPF